MRVGRKFVVEFEARERGERAKISRGRTPFIFTERLNDYKPRMLPSLNGENLSQVCSLSEGRKGSVSMVQLSGDESFFTFPSSVPSPGLSLPAFKWKSFSSEESESEKFFMLGLGQLWSSTLDPSWSDEDTCHVCD